MEITEDHLFPRNNLAMTGKQNLCIEPRQPLDAFSQQPGAASGKICSPDTLKEDEVSREKGLPFRPVDRKGTWGMPGGMKNVECRCPQSKLPFLQIEVDPE